MEGGIVEVGGDGGGVFVHVHVVPLILTFEGGIPAASPDLVDLPFDRFVLEDFLYMRST